MTTSRVCLLILVLLVAGCLHSVPAQEGTVSPSELNTRMKQYHDKDVIVRGYVTLVPEAHNLYQSRELKTEFERRWDSDDPVFDPKDYQKYCLTIANPDVLFGRRDVLNGTTITVKGKFIEDYLDGRIDMGACPLPTAIVIDEGDLKRRYPAIFAN